MTFFRVLSSCRSVAARRAFMPAPLVLGRSARFFASGMRYLDTHEYIRVDAKTGEATVGVTDYAQQELGDVVYVELPTVGDIFKKGDAFGSVESVKAASQVYAPVDGEVIEINETLSDDSGLINSSPEDKGWIMKIKVTDPSQVEKLMDEAAYTTLCESEAH